MSVLAQHAQNRDKPSVAPKMVGAPLANINQSGLPAELKARDQWLVWRFEEREGKRTKVPYQALTNTLRRADSTRPETWGTFDSALAALATGSYNGLGYVFSKDDPYTGIDLDGCIDTETGEFSAAAAAIIDQLDTYTELSPSERGLHLICRANLQTLKGRKKGSVELYDRGRFFTMTGNVYGAPRPLAERQAAVEAFHAGIFVQTAAPSATPLRDRLAVALDDQQLLVKMFAAKNGAEIKALYDGNISAYALEGNDGRSEADLALSSHLMWWTGNDVARADRFFRSSGLHRAKWDEQHSGDGRSYGQLTLERAAAAGGGYSGYVSPRAVPPQNAAVVLPPPDQPPAKNEPLPASRRRLILNPDRHQQAADIIRALNDQGDAPEIFQRGRDLVRVVRTDGIPVVETLTHDSIRSFAQERLECVKQVPTGKKDPEGNPIVAEVPANLTRDTAAYILSASSWPFPELRGIVSTPHYSAAGEPVTEAGYSSKSKLYLDLGGFKPRAVSDAPTATEVFEAKRLILDELLGDFPFVERASRAHALALGLLPFTRVMIDGPTPLHASDAASEGTGKGLLVEALTRVAADLPPTTLTEGRDDDEWRKRITSTLLGSPTVLMIDNVTRRLDSGALASVLTSGVWNDRLLGQSKNASIPNLACWTATGNNLVTSKEIARRLVWMRLDAKMERPWERSAFKHADLMAWVGERRADLVWAFMTLVQNWLALGRPKGATKLGSYEAWSEVIGGILTAADVPGFLENREKLYERADTESAEWRTFVNLWADRYETREVRVADLHQLAMSNDALLSVLGDGTAQSQKIRLGRALGKRQDRVIGSYTICKGRGDTKNHVEGYYLAAQSEPGGECGGELGSNAGSGGESKNALPALENPSVTRNEQLAGSGGELNDPFNVNTPKLEQHNNQGEYAGKPPATPRRRSKNPSVTQKEQRGVEKHTPRYPPLPPAHSPPFWPTVAEHPFKAETPRHDFLDQALKIVGRQGKRFTEPQPPRDEALVLYRRACLGKDCAELERGAGATGVHAEALALYGAARELAALGKTNLSVWAEVAEAYVANRQRRQN